MDPWDDRQLAEEFDRAADRYDLLTRLNPGYHRALRRAAGALMGRLGGGADALWDLGCGSGLSTRALLSATPESTRIVGLDASAGMLARARAKDWPARVSFVQASAQDLPRVAAEQLAGLADGVLAAYLMRNVPPEQRDEVLASIHDQLRPGGWLALQDYHVKGSRSAAAVWTAVCWGVVTPLATVTRGNPAIYRYLWRSVLDNDSTAELADRLTRAGFTDLRWHTAGGWQRGILHTVLAQKPHTDQQPDPAPDPEENV